MARIRIHFSKKNYGAFTSHIDLPVLFGRAARRAGLRPEQTQGFSPHPRLALCPPLPVGVTGLREPADFWFEDWRDDLLDAWRAHMPQDIDIVEAWEIDAQSVSLNKLCTAASYEIRPTGGASADDVAALLAGVLTSEGALRAICASSGVVCVTAGELERCGASRMVRELIASGLIDGWGDLAMTRTLVGRWSAERGQIIPLTEEF